MDLREREYTKEGINETYFYTMTHRSIVIDATKNGNAKRSLNHSCSPNVEGVVEDTSISFYTIKDIRAGEELTIDYLMEKGDERIRYTCSDDNCKIFLDYYEE